MVRSIICALTIFARCLQILFALVALSCLAALLGSNSGGPALVNYSLWVTIIDILEGVLGIFFCIVAVQYKNAGSSGNTQSRNASSLDSSKSNLCFSSMLGCVVGFFTLCAAIAFAAILPANTCNGEVRPPARTYDRNVLKRMQVSRDQNSVALGSMTRCTTGQAATAFLWFTAAFLGLGIIGSYASMEHLDDQTISPREVFEILLNKKKDDPQPSNDTTSGAARNARARPPMTSHAAPNVPHPSPAATTQPRNHEGSEGPPSYLEVATIDERVAEMPDPSTSREQDHGVPWRGFSSLFSHRKDPGDAADETA